MPREWGEWQNWARLILVEREKIAQRCAQDAYEQRVQRALCKQPNGLGTVYFLTMFGWVFDPREDEESSVAPFILYPRQAEFLLALDGVMQRPKGPLASLAVPKARGVGATWLAAGDGTWRFLFKKMYQGRVVSRNEDMVDQVGSPDSWMWKYDYILKHLPHWLLPAGFSVERRAGNRYRTHMKILNPDNGSAIIGEATSSGVGVGGRASRYDIDEAARIAGLRGIWAQLAETTNHRLALSTHNVAESTDFWDMCNASNGWPEIPTFEMPWQTILTRDAAWLENTRQTLPDAEFQQEIMMNPWAGISSWVYPRAKAIKPFYFQVDRGLGPVVHGLDDGYDDDFAIVWAQWDEKREKLHVLDGYTNSHLPIDFYGHLLKGEAVGSFPWDPEALRIMDWINRHQTYKGIFIGDRHGDNTDLTTGESPWMRLQTKHGIYVQPSPVHLNTLKDRRDALSGILDSTEFCDSPGGLNVLRAVQNNKFPVKGSGSQATHEIRRPIHDWTSHPTTALEYIATNLSSRQSMGGAKPHDPVNNRVLARGQDPFGRGSKNRIIAQW